MKKVVAIVGIVVASAWFVPPAFAHHSQNSGTRCGCGGHAKAKPPVSFKRLPRPGTRATCPVMKHAFKVKAKNAYSRYKGRYYLFCCPGCKPKFDANPSKYLKRS